MRVAILRRTPKASFSMDVYADELIRGLKAVRPSWKVIELSPESPKRFSRLHFSTGLQKYYERYWKFPQRLNGIDVDIFHIIDHSDGHLARYLNKIKKPTIITCHDLINLIKPETFKGKADFPVVSMTAWKMAIRGMCSADHIISVSSHTAKDISRYLGVELDRVSVVPNAVNPAFHPMESESAHLIREELGILPEETCLLNVGSNNARKNLSTILKVVKILRDRNWPIRFIKVGSDFNQNQKDYIQENSLDDKVQYVGQPNDKLLIGFYNAADILIAPSTYEGFGLTVLEAMACGTPVITSNVSSLPEVAGDAAILTDPMDVQAIVDAITRLQQDDSYQQKLVKKGLVRASLFTWEKTAEKVAFVYENILSEKHYTKFT